MVMGKCWLFPWQQIPKLTETISLSILKLNSSASMATEVIKRCKLKCCTGMMAWQERHLFGGNNTKNFKLEASLCPKAHCSHGRGIPTYAPSSILGFCPCLISGISVHHTCEQIKGLCLPEGQRGGSAEGGEVTEPILMYSQLDSQ